MSLHGFAEALLDNVGSYLGLVAILYVWNPFKIFGSVADFE